MVRFGLTDRGRRGLRFASVFGIELGFILSEICYLSANFARPYCFAFRRSSELPLSLFCPFRTKNPAPLARGAEDLCFASVFGIELGFILSEI